MHSKSGGSSLQAAQVYAASVLFGYFVRRVDARFNLEKAAGTMPGDAVARLEALSSRVQVARMGRLRQR